MPRICAARCAVARTAALLLPGLVESHTHLDKTMWGMDWYRNEVGPRLTDKIDNERMNKRRLDLDPAGREQFGRQRPAIDKIGSTVRLGTSQRFVVVAGDH